MTSPLLTSPLLTSQDAAQALGVKLETLYAYVSRGMLTRRRGPDGRSSLFDASEVARLRRRHRGAPGAVEVPVRSNLTLIDGERLFYRGVDAVRLATAVTFEGAATWLWTSTRDAGLPWVAPEPVVALGRAASGLLPDSAHLADRVRAVVAVVAAADPMRFDLRAEAAVESARTLLAAVVDALPLRRRGRPPAVVLDSGERVAGALAGRLWPRLTPLAPSEARVRALNAAMVLLADHELATSTFGARVAASTRADPYAVVTAGLGVMAGPLHGSASAAVGDLLAEAAATDPDRAVAQVMRREGRVPGFGHRLYPNGDPRARRLFELVGEAGVDAARWQLIEATLAASGRRAPVAANVDFALAGLCFATGMPADAGEAIFSIARMAGWIAHALEEYGEEPLRFRPRAVYTGPPPET